MCNLIHVQALLNNFEPTYIYILKYILLFFVSVFKLLYDKTIISLNEKMIYRIYCNIAICIDVIYFNKEKINYL
jgi:hypothetical protein